MHDHNRYGHEHRPMLEPDYIANNHHDQLPVVSTIGAGPRGDDVLAEIIESDADTFKFRLFSERTHETHFISPNLSAGQITVSQSPGVKDYFTISVSRDGQVVNNIVQLPEGVAGAKAFILTETIARQTTNVYVAPVGSLAYDWHTSNPSKPIPVNGDTIIFFCTDESGTYVSYGHVVTMQTTTDVLFTCATYALLPPGPKGDDGEKGTFAMPHAVGVGPDEEPRVQDVSTDPSVAELWFYIPRGKDGTSMVVAEGHHKLPGSTKPLPDLPPIDQAPDGYAYVVDPDDTPEGQVDLYYKAPGVTTWTIFPKWGGVPGKNAEVKIGSITEGPVGTPYNIVSRVDETTNVTYLDFTVPVPGIADYQTPGVVMPDGITVGVDPYGLLYAVNPESDTAIEISVVREICVW